jgi:hypothetical protein
MDKHTYRHLIFAAARSSIWYVLRPAMYCVLLPWSCCRNTTTTLLSRASPKTITSLASYKSSSLFLSHGSFYKTSPSYYSSLTLQFLVVVVSIIVVALVLWWVNNLRPTLGLRTTFDTFLSRTSSVDVLTYYIIQCGYMINAKILESKLL